MIPLINIDSVRKERIVRVYLASPYTIGNQQDNVDCQINMAAYLLDRGFFPFAPLLCHYIDQKHPRDYDVWLKWCIAWLPQCNAVLRLPGHSRGADLEVELAISKNIPVFHIVGDLICHFTQLN
jgi:hypothetical protein